MIGYIYKTTNLKNGKIYIGQHISTVFEPNKYIGSGCLFKKIIERDGKQNFKCELLEECDTIEQLHSRERYYIKLFNAQDRSIGYNIADGGDEPWNRGKKMSLQYCKKNSEAQRNLAPNINCYDFNTGKLIKVFNSCYDAVEELDTKVKANVRTVASRIHVVCKLGKGHAYGYIWRYNSKYKDILILSEEELNIEHLNPRAKILQQFDLQGNLIAEFESAAQYSKQLAEDYKEQRRIARGINGCCVGDSKTYKGFIWKYKN